MEEKTPVLLEKLYRLYRQRVNPVGKTYMFVDEIQHIRGWEQWIETYRESGEVKFIVTGSSSKLSSKEFGTLLTGRHIDLTLLPFSFADFVRSKGIEVSSLSIELKSDLIKNLLFSYLDSGGFPEILLNFPEENGTKILEAYFDDIIYRDIVERWNIRDVLLTKRIALYALKSSGNLLSYRKIQKALEQTSGKTSTSTISENMSHLSETYILFEVELHTNSVKKALINPRKVYSVDTGLRKAVVKPLTEDFGKDGENIVFLELLRRGYEVTFWKTDKTEVDFVASGRTGDLVINVTMSNLDDLDLRERELRGLLEFEGERSRRILLNSDIEDTLKIHDKTIELIPLWKWLLIEDFLPSR
ncbi:ATPase [Mesotoga sp. Brook.08.YT.4.2.5.2.]|nr:ATPase [Mesotoga sp. SC_4PWL113PWK15]RDI90161.1 ATPase [Mesotoga sp. Brook.08.YT.4.2.5.2.]